MLHENKTKMIFKIPIPDTSNEERFRKLMKISDKLKGVDHQYIETKFEKAIERFREKLFNSSGIPKKYLYNE